VGAAERFHRRKYIGDSIEAVHAAESKLRGVALNSDEVQAFTALEVAHDLEALASILRAGAADQTDSPEPLQTTRQHQTVADSARRL
jgi:hypothetical protein